MPDAEGYIASVVTRETGSGSIKCPWIVRVAPGQRVNVTLFDFDVTPTAVRGDTCHVYAIIRDVPSAAAVSEVTVCGGGDRRVKSVFLSETNSVEIEIVARGADTAHDSMPYFLLHYTGLQLFLLSIFLTFKFITP